MGLGFGATVHVPAFLSEGWQIPVVWSRRLERAKEQAAAFDIPDATDDFRALIARTDIDAVAIATPPAAHHEMVMAALAAGKHVLCEKPFARNSLEARAMYDAARATGLIGMIAHEFRFAPQRSFIKQLLDEGYVGVPQTAQLELFMGGRRVTQPPPLGASVSEGGGVLGGLGSHFIDGLRHWFGDVREVSGLVRCLRPERTDPKTGAIVRTDAEDTFQFSLTFEGGLVASMSASMAGGPGQGGRTFISGTEGSLFAAQQGGNPEPGGTVLGAQLGTRTLAELPMPGSHRPFEDERDHRLVAFRLLVREFERGIAEGTSPAPSFEDGWRCQQVMDAVRESSATGRTVKIA
ncbi:MAG: Gfo/Idh/MocA family oxidoreductase [Dehalococcoidia bacterium]|nr:MAG: Gfo/Idh/MocA family oxidoreductase [Dehalococcoidia bacterium]